MCARGQREGSAVMRAVILGANGYLARNLIRVNQMCGYADMTLFGHQAEHMDGVPGYQQIDYGSEDQMKMAVSNCDVIYYFVGKVGTAQGFDIPETYLDLNERILLRLLKVCRDLGSKAKIVFPSTRLVYQGSSSALPEEAPKQFLTPYAMQKFASEQYLEMYHRLHGVNYCVLRIGVPYGTLVQPVSSYGTLDFFLRQANEKHQISIYGDGKQRRSFTHILDLCQMLWQAGIREDCINDVYNMSGEDCSIGEVAGKVAVATGAEVVYQPWPVSAKILESGSTVFDTQKLDKLLQVKHTYSVDRWVSENILGECTEMNDNMNVKTTRGGYRLV